MGKEIIKKMGVCLAMLSLFSFRGAGQICSTWVWSNDTMQQVAVLVDQYMVCTAYDTGSRAFYHTWGGPYRIQGDTLTVQLQFHTVDKNKVGTSVEWKIQVDHDGLVWPLDGAGQQWTKTDEGTTPLTGVWRIAGRRQEGKMNAIALNPRRTLKILSGSRFQWIAINTETGEFFGTGGGTYTFQNGVYAEHIAFFSRDGSRVGATLTFNGQLENGNWHHSGLSSKGEPIDEIWTRDFGK